MTTRTRTRKLAPAVFGLALASVGTSCSLALDYDQTQCENAEDCAKRGFTNASCQQNVCVVETGSSGTETGATSSSSGMVIPGFECLGTFKNPDPMGMPVNQTFYFENAGSALPMMPGTVEADLCSPLTAECISPTQSNIQLDANGELTVPVGMLPGYLRLEDAMPMAGVGGGMNKPNPMDFRPVLVYENRPVVLPPVKKSVRVISYADFETLALIVQATEEPTTHGIVLVLTTDCNDQRAAGVQVEVDPQDTDDKTVAAYFKGQLPKLGQTETDSQGAFAMVNVPVQPNGDAKAVTFSTKLAATGQRIGSATVFVRAGWITYFHIGPTENGM